MAGEQAKGGPTAKLYKGHLYDLDADVEKEHAKRVKEEKEASSEEAMGKDGGAWREFNIPGTSGSAEAQPEAGVVNDDKLAKKSSKEADKAAKESERK